ncbi:MAG: hypothetical protein IT200_09800 [Thermoleophilia bacterium]|nr:hypothetical protein [Thermoleophilia bacterium]
MSTTPPPPAGTPGGPGGDEPPPVETFTQYDKERDAYHCSYGPLAPARTIWDPEREIQVRLDLTSRRVVGFSIPDFTAWHQKHASEDGGFEMDLPAFWEGDLPEA